jgi:hypothetical protein
MLHPQIGAVPPGRRERADAYAFTSSRTGSSWPTARTAAASLARSSASAGVLYGLSPSSWLSHRRTWEGRWTGLQGRRAVWLGEISFGFYICQGVVVFYGRTLFGAEPFATPVALGVSALLFAATILAGWALFAGVERPVMQR